MAEWTPSRPERAVPEWQEAVSAPALPAHPAPLAVERPGLGTQARRRRRTLSGPQRIIAAFVVLALAIGAVTVVGSSSTRLYGSLPPWQTSAVADLRSTPRAGGWSTDLSRDVLPGVPPRCADFGASTQGDGRVVVVASPPALGSSTSCSVATLAQVSATVALLDTATGRIVWTRDLSRSFPSSVGPLSIAATFVVAAAHRVVVQFVVDGKDTLATLSLATGAVLESHSFGAAETGFAPQLAGRLVLFGARPSREGAINWILADVAKLGSPIWTGTTEDSVPLLLTPRAVFTDFGHRSIRIDGTTGSVSSLGNGLVDLTSAVVVDHDLYTVGSAPSGLIVTAWNDRGTRLWSRSSVGSLAGVSRDCVLTSLLGADKMSCIDRASGAKRWTAPVPSSAVAYGVPGQTSDDVLVLGAGSDTVAISVLAGETGRTRFTLRADNEASVLTLARTTGYLVETTQAGTTTEIRAFDASSGRTLWTRSGETAGQTQLWGGRLVELAPDGVATELTDPPGIVLGR